MNEGRTRQMSESIIPSWQDAAERWKKDNDRLRAQVAELRRALNNLLNDCINFDGGKLTEVFQVEATAILDQTEDKGATQPNHY